MKAMTKSILYALTLVTSLTASNMVLAAEHGYWVESALCGEIDPIAIGDACVFEVANDDEHFLVIMDLDFVEGELGQDIERTDVTLEKRGLKKAKKAQLEVLRGLFPQNLKLYTIASEFVRFEHLDGDK